MTLEKTETSVIVGVHFITPTELRNRSFHHTDREAETSKTSGLQSFGVCTAKRVGACPHKHVCSFLQTLNRTRSLDEAARDETRAHGTNIAIDAEGENEDEVDDPREVRQTRHVSSRNSFPGQIRRGAAATSCGLALILSGSFLT